MATYVFRNIPNELWDKFKDKALKLEKSPRELIVELLNKYVYENKDDRNNS